MSLMTMSDAQFKRVCRLAKDECANYVSDKCILMAAPCAQLKCKNGLCVYFKESVLPLDKDLKFELCKN